MRIHVLEGRLAIHPRFWMILQLNDSLFWGLGVWGWLCLSWACCVRVVCSLSIGKFGCACTSQADLLRCFFLQTQCLIFSLASSHSWISRHSLVHGFILNKSSSLILKGRHPQFFPPLKTIRNPPLNGRFGRWRFLWKWPSDQGTQSNHFRSCFIFCVGVAHGKTWEELAESLLETQHFNLKSLVKSQIDGNAIQIHTFHRKFDWFVWIWIIFLLWRNYDYNVYIYIYTYNCYLQEGY